MIVIPSPDDAQRLRKCLKTLPAAGALGLLIGMELLGWNGPWFRLAYVPAVILAAWFAGGPFVLVLLSCSAVAKWQLANSWMTNSAPSSYEMHEVLIWFGECSAMAVLASLLRRTREQANHLAGRDPLTGLANRTALLNRLEAEINRSRRTGQPLTLAYFDCDHFKEVNDSLGHAAGDALLREVAKTLLCGIRNYDLAARVGGDEFALLLPATNPESAKAVMERLTRQLRTAMATASWPTTVSIGVVTIHELRDSGEELMAVADRAMYAAKQSMRGSAHFVSR